jgi:hypothetical protein
MYYKALLVTCLEFEDIPARRWFRFRGFLLDLFGGCLYLAFGFILLGLSSRFLCRLLGGLGIFDFLHL